MTHGDEVRSGMWFIFISKICLCFFCDSGAIFFCLTKHRHTDKSASNAKTVFQRNGSADSRVAAGAKPAMRGRRRSFDGCAEQFAR
jgi:hypothetical protein